MRIFSVCLFTLILLLILTLDVPSTFAQTAYQFPIATAGQINEALQKIAPIRFLPSHPLYFLISAKENVSRFFKSSSAKKAEFDLVLSGKRLKEVYLLIEKGDLTNAAKDLIRYQKRTDKMINQLQKAKSQNQDVVTLSSSIAENFQYHEILFYAINEKGLNLASRMDKNLNFEGNFSGAVSSFTAAINAIDEIQPGVKNRFKTVPNTSSSEQEIVPIPVPTLSPQFLDSSPSAKPRRIIY